MPLAFKICPAPMAMVAPSPFQLFLILRKNMPSALDKHVPFFGDGRGGNTYGRQRNLPLNSLRYLGRQGRDPQPFSLARSRGGTSSYDELANLLRRAGDRRGSNLDAELQRERYAQGRRGLGYGHSYSRGPDSDNGRGLSDYSRLSDELASKQRRNALTDALLASLTSSKKHGSTNTHHASHSHEHSHRHERGCGHSNQCDRDNGRSCQGKHKHCTGGHSHCNDCEETDLKTKDVALRGKAYKIRKAFLADMGKFEHDLIKLVDKKTEEELPDSVIQLLVDYINKESCESKNMVDLVGLSLLASTLGYTSGIEGSLRELKEASAGSHVRREDLTKICGMITMSGKVDDGLRTWLRNFLSSPNIIQELWHSQAFQELNHNHPEVWIRLQGILRQGGTEDELDFPVF